MSDDSQKQKETKKEGLLKLSEQQPMRKGSVWARLRANFFTGLVIAAPISITVYITWWFISLFDNWIKPLVPAGYNPDDYLPFSVPGVGLLFAFIGLTILGAFAANLLGRTLVAYGETVLDRMPVVRNLYKALKQIFETVLSQSNSSFRQVGLIEYPRQGLYALVFISTDTKGEVAKRAAKGKKMLSVFLPTTPNPTSGFLLFVPQKDVMIMDMSVEEAAKLVISAGLVVPGEQLPEPQGDDVAVFTKDDIKELTKIKD